MATKKRPKTITEELVARKKAPDLKTEEKRDEKGLFQEGTAPGPGRPPGMANKVTREMKDFFQYLVEQNQDKVIAAMEKLFILKPEAFMNYFIQSSEFVLPKLKRNELTGKDGEKLIYTDDQAAKILDIVTKHKKN